LGTLVAGLMPRWNGGIHVHTIKLKVAYMERPEELPGGQAIAVLKKKNENGGGSREKTNRRMKR